MYIYYSMVKLVLPKDKLYESDFVNISVDIIQALNIARKGAKIYF